MRTATQLEVTHYDVKLSAIREVDGGTLESTLAILRQAPKPPLLHCKSGADRSGLIAALYLFAIEGQPWSNRLLALIGESSLPALKDSW